MSKVAREITFVNHEYKGYAHEITNTEIKLYQQKKRNEMNGSTENARSVHIVKDENVIIAICDFCSNIFSRENADFVCEKNDWGFSATIATPMSTLFQNVLIVKNATATFVREGGWIVKNVAACCAISVTWHKTLMRREGINVLWK